MRDLERLLDHVTPVVVSDNIISLDALRNAGKVVKSCKSASLIDLGDGVFCAEFHTKMNAIGEDIISMLHKSGEIVSQDFEGLVIANHGTNFSVGAKSSTRSPDTSVCAPSRAATTGASC